MKKLEEDRKKAMKKYNNKLKKDKYYGKSSIKKK